MRPGRSARVLIEVEANLARAPLGGRFIGAALENGLANGEMHFHRRTSTAFACA